MKSDSFFNNRNITADTEHTTAISTIAYDVEDLLVAGFDTVQIGEELELAKLEGDFPPDLELVVAFLKLLSGSIQQACTAKCISFTENHRMLNYSLHKKE